MNVDQVIQVVQVSYPQVYLACHTRHQRKRSTDHALSSRDAAILSHLSPQQPISPSKLATHLGVSRSTVSEALKRLTQLGFIARTSSDGAARATSVVLAPKGVRAIRDTSVLETARLRQALAHASREDLSAIAFGMTRLAEACRHIDSGEIAR